MAAFAAPRPRPAAPPPPPVTAFGEAWSDLARHPARASAAFAELGERHPGIADLALYGRARAELGLRDGKGLELLDSIVSRWPSGVLARQAREQIAARSLPAARSADTAEIPLLRRLLAGGVSSGTRARLEERLVRALRLSGKTAEAQDLFVACLPRLGLDGIGRGLAQLGTDSAWLVSSRLRRPLALAWWRLGRVDTGLALLDSVDQGREDEDASSWIVRGRTALDRGRVNEAIAAFRKAAQNPRDQDALMWLGRGLERSGRLEDAAAVWDEFARRWPGSAKGQEILWGKGIESEKAGRCPDAAVWFAKVREGGGRRAEWTRFREGYCWYRAGAWERAAEVLGEQRRLASAGSQRDAAWYFQAAALERAGRGEEARATWAALAAASPWSFHGHLARRRLGTDSAFADSLARQPLEASDRILTAAWSQAPSLVSADTAAMVRFLCARATGDELLAQAESKALDQGLGGKAARFFALADWLKALGLADEAAPRTRRALSSLSPDELARASRPLLAMVYPVVYEDALRPLTAGDTVIDAAFVHSVMRQESGFDRYARSGAGAVGLLQLMPTTAASVARRIGMRSYSQARLTDPAVNLRLGVAYLRDLSRIWEGDRALVLANYNAGPSPTSRWKPAFDSLPLEQAVEEITYWETRDYVKKCLGNWWTYRLVHPEIR